MKSKDQSRTETNVLNFTKELFESDRDRDQAQMLKRYCQFRRSFPEKERPCYCGHTVDCDCADPGISEFRSGLQSGGIDGETLLKSFLWQPEDK